VFTDGLAVVETRAGSWDEEGQLASMEDSFSPKDNFARSVIKIEFPRHRTVANKDPDVVHAVELPVQGRDRH
jgi:hypothetical protein